MSDKCSLFSSKQQTQKKHLIKKIKHLVYNIRITQDLLKIFSHLITDLMPVS